MAGAGASPGRLPLPADLPVGGSLGTDRCRRDPQGHLSTPHPLQEPGAIALEGTLCSCPDSGAVSHPTGWDPAPGRGALAEPLLRGFTLRHGVRAAGGR